MSAGRTSRAGAARGPTSPRPSTPPRGREGAHRGGGQPADQAGVDHRRWTTAGTQLRRVPPHLPEPGVTLVPHPGREPHRERRHPGLPEGRALDTRTAPPGAELDFGGQVILILWPPEHGKTAFWEDFDTYALSRWPWFRITVGSERSRHSEKVCEFVRSRLEHDAPGFARMRARFGPYAPPPGRARQSQPWNRTFFNVQKKPWAGERDNSMTPLGISGSVIGTQADLLQVDDPQSRKSLNRTPELVDVFTQDWLSRPGPTGLTVILMNRVGPDDFPQALIDRGVVDEVIRVPVWDPERGWAWPERYSHQHYLKMRRNVGEEAWERNYMQRGLAARTMSFRPDHVEPCKNPLRSVTHPPTEGRRVPP
jgi:hypothetical protein